MVYKVLAKSKSGKHKARMYLPCRRTVIYSNRQAYFLQFPYLIFVKTDDYLRLAFASKLITSPDDLVYRPAIGNVYSGDDTYKWYVCGMDWYGFGGDFKNKIAAFWQTMFSTEGGRKSAKEMFPEGKPLKTWAKLSRKPDALDIILKRVENITQCMPAYQFVAGSITPKLNCTWVTEKRKR